MKAAILEGDRNIHCADAAEPEISPHQVLVRSAAAGICGFGMPILLAGTLAAMLTGEFYGRSEAAPVAWALLTAPVSPGAIWIGRAGAVASGATVGALVVWLAAGGLAALGAKLARGFGVAVDLSWPRTPDAGLLLLSLPVAAIAVTGWRHPPGSPVMRQPRVRPDVVPGRG